MHTFAEKPKATQHNTPIKLAGITPSYFRREKNSTLACQWNQVVQPIPQVRAKELDVGLTGAARLRIRHDFSRIPIHPKTAGQPPTTRNNIAVSSPEDAHEREAVAAAGRAMSIVVPTQEPLAGAASADHDADGEGKVQLLRRKANAALRAEMPSATAMGLDAAASGGIPLTAELRAYFEPRFGHDMSHVRVHVGDRAAEGAKAVEARAYTVGSDIVFGVGEYAPSTNDGKRLLAHELAHVVQHAGFPAHVRRVITSDPRASLGGFFSGKGIKDVIVSANAYSLGSSASKGPVSEGSTLVVGGEILIDMLSSPRVFHVSGDSDTTAASNLNEHVKARAGIVSFAAQKRYGFASRTGWLMNSDYYDWDERKGTWKIKPNVDKQTAWNDLNINAHKYAIGCAAATDLTMKGGSKGANIIDKPSSDNTDWVPGDAGYIENTKFHTESDIGLLGENIIYTGNNMFWGHLPGSVTYRTLTDWTAMVQHWNGGAKVDNKRELPATGLVDA